jgi:hypothetical protein
MAEKNGEAGLTIALRGPNGDVLNVRVVVDAHVHPLARCVHHSAMREVPSRADVPVDHVTIVRHKLNR